MGNLNQALASRLNQTQAALEELQRLAVSRADENTALASRLNQTQAALEEMQHLAVDRLSQSRILQDALNATQALVADRDATVNRQQSEHVDLSTRYEQAALKLATQGDRLQKSESSLALALDEGQVWRENYLTILNSRAWRLICVTRKLLRLGRGHSNPTINHPKTRV
jgi:chromosome segregation ATPase